MKICGISDLHGYLPTNIEKCDVVVICGDIVPLEIQRSGTYSKEWFKKEFAAWVKQLPCERVIFIGGNHDFWFNQEGFDSLDSFIIDCELGDKLFYLEDNSYTYNGITFYGCPWCEGPTQWAFCPNSVTKYEDIFAHYNNIPDCDVLLLHQPPRVDKVGTSYPNTNHERDFGSEILKNIIVKKDIPTVFCGHIHSGIHNGITLKGEVTTMVYNVSIKDEDYKVAYKPTYIEI